MLRYYSVDEVCALFQIDASTLRRWRAPLKLALHVDPSCRTRRLYDDDQVLALATAHRRFAVVANLERAELSAQLSQLLSRVERLERVVSRRGGSDGDGDDLPGIQFLG